MTLLDKFKGGGASSRIGEGTFPARIVQIIDVGTQTDEWKGEKKHINKLWITFELPTETIVVDGEEKPRWLGSEFTKSTNEKARLTKVINACNKEASTFNDLLGKPLLVEVGTTSGGKDKWVGASQVPRGMGVAEAENKLVYFDIENPDTDILNSLPDFLVDKIKAAPEFKFEEVGDDKFEDDIPF